MKSKSDVQLQLLKELDEICNENNLTYILIGFNSLNAFRNHTIKNGPRITAVAMTQGDIDRFCKIVEEKYSETRYIEGLNNNSRYGPYNFSYGDKNTTDFHVIQLNRNKHHGINIRLYPIRRAAKLNGEPIDNWTPRLLKERKIRKFINKRVENNRFRYMKYGLSGLHAAYSLTGGGKRYYKEIRRNSFIDKWEDIQNYSLVRMGNNELSTKFFKGVEKYDVDGLSIPFPLHIDEYFTEVYGDDYKEVIINPATQRVRDIVDTEFGYDEILGETKDILKEIRSIHEEIIWERRKFENEKTAVNNVWNLVEMTDDQINFINFFEEYDGDLTKYNLDDEKEFHKLHGILSPVIDSLRFYSRRGMTFSVNPTVDKLVEDVLIKDGEQDLVNEIKNISKKEYFVE